MPRHIFDFGVPDRFVSGTVGEPGSRTFFLQARRGTAVLSVALEKVQVQALADRLGLLLAELSRRGVRVPEALAPHDDDTSPLDEPLVEAFRVGTMTIGWDADAGVVVLEVRSRVEDDEDDEDEDEDEDATEENDEATLDLMLLVQAAVDAEEAESEEAESEEAEDDEEDEDEDEDEEISDDDPDGPDLVRVRLTPLRVRAFVERALRVVAAGRPPCPLCGRPLDPGGHICPRKNGYVH